jgi:hypothetical protein
MTEARNVFTQSQELRRDTKTVGQAFLKAELTTALTFVRAALQAGNDPERKRRNQAYARKVFDTITTLSRRLSPPAVFGESAYAEGLEELRAALEKLGEPL